MLTNQIVFNVICEKISKKKYFQIKEKSKSVNVEYLLLEIKFLKKITNFIRLSSKSRTIIMMVIIR